MTSEVALASGISSLGLWKASAKAPLWLSPDQTHSNAIASHGKLLYILNETGGITAVNLQPLDPSIGIFSKELQLPNVEHFEKQSLHVNKDGQLLAVVGKSGILVVETPNLELKAELPLLCKSKVIDLANPADPELAIIKVAWHPLSPIHLVILTNDNTIRMFNVENTSAGPEQTYLVDRQLVDNEDEPELIVEIVNFCFGDTSVASWQAFSILLLSSDTFVYVLCPVVPYSTFIPSHYFNSLRRVILSQRDELASNESDPRRHSPLKSLESRHLYLDSQLKWIYSVCGIVNDRRNASLTDQHFTSNLDTFTVNPNKISANPNKKRNYFELLLQGPLTTDMPPSKSVQGATILLPEVRPHDIFVISSLPLVLGRTHSSGHVELLVAVNSQISPSWKTHYGSFNPSKPDLLFWSGIDLSLSSGDLEKNEISSNGAHKQVISAPIILPTPPTLLQGLSSSAPTGLNSLSTDNDAVSHFYLYSSCGIVRVHVPWIAHIDSILTERSRARESPPTSIQLVWNCVTIDQPLPIIHGVTPYVKPRHPNDSIMILAEYDHTTEFIATSVPKDPKLLQRARQLSALFASPFQSTPATLTNSAEAAARTSTPKTDTRTTPNKTTSSLVRSASGGALSATNLDSTPSRIAFDEHFADYLPSWVTPAKLGPKTFRGSGPSEVLTSSTHLEFYKLISRQFDSCHTQLEEMAENMEIRITNLEKLAKQDQTDYRTQCDRLRSVAGSELQLVQRLSQSKATHDSFVERLESVKAVFRFIADRAVPVDAAWLDQLQTLHKNIEQHKTTLETIETQLNGVITDMQKIQLRERDVPELNAEQANAFKTVLTTQQRDISSMTAALRQVLSKVDAIEKNE